MTRTLSSNFSWMSSRLLDNLDPGTPDIIGFPAHAMRIEAVGFHASSAYCCLLHGHTMARLACDALAGRKALLNV